MNKVLELLDIVKTYDSGEETLHVLRGCKLSLVAGELVALTGPSGAGKSTLLQIVGLLDNANTGTVRLNGEDVSQASEKERTLARRLGIGFVYQFHHLLPEFTAQENIALAMMIAGQDELDANRRAMELLDSVGLKERARHKPAKLSGGEQQRVAIARALANKPKLLLADEPTGNLDPQTSDRVFDLLLELSEKAGLAALIATHNHQLAARMNRRIELKDGKVYNL